MNLRNHPFLASVVGSYSGTILQLIITLPSDPVPDWLLSELWAVPIIVGAYGLLSMPFVAIGLAVFGLAPVRALKTYEDRVWIGPAAVVYGYGSAKLLYWGVDQQLLFQQYCLTDLKLEDPAVFFGVPTATIWWLLNRSAPQSPPKSSPPYPSR